MAATVTRTSSGCADRRKPPLRWLQSLLVALLAAGLALLGVWLVMLWSGAGAPSLTDFGQRHPGLGGAFGLLSTALVLVSTLVQRRKRKSR